MRLYNQNSTSDRQPNERSSKRFGLLRLFRNLDNVQDWLVFLLCIVLIIEMVLLVVQIFMSLQINPDFKQITSDSLFIFILVELFRLLAVYLEKHHISIVVAVEVTVVSVLREVIVEGLLHMNWVQVLVICAFLLAASVLLFIGAKIESENTERHN
ncbi:MAG: phosphate-starvation-inducible PsiE family protein [Hydrococcus sp. Prado102]|nr:phosphate-starvation-inducible PsiE family protein [Hydrococcus sp. Prado102]